ncbi:MAG: ketoacyl-ACP synthase III [Anaeromyxobacter sp.]|nr:ketoacyl-ACP synthase III [Anaeromyxobacter sp.]MBL0276425.1 ketoacyl-ACP synthase III [Anaeromyxobacter sp.]
MRRARILSTGRYVPERVVTNAELEVRLGQPVDQWLRENVGIERRHVMADDQVTSDLCLEAARDALARAGLGPEDLDLIVVATDTPDQPSPATATVLQHKLGARHAGTYDLNCACAGFVTALDVAAKTIMADEAYRHVLVVGAYGMTRFVDWTDKKTCTLFADGAGAVVLGAGDSPGFLGARLEAHGEYHDALGIYTGGTLHPATPERVAAEGRPAVRFVRKFPSTFNTERWPALLRTVLARCDLEVDDVSLFVFTQLNLRTIEATMAAMGQPMSKTHWTMDKWGYTGSACIPMTLDDAVRLGRVRAGDLVALCASGGGLAMATALVRWTA